MKIDIIYRQPKQNKEKVSSMTKTYIPLTTPDELKALIDAIEQLKAKVGIRKNIRDYGIQEDEFMASLDEMVNRHSTTSAPVQIPVIPSSARSVRCT